MKFILGSWGNWYVGWESLTKIVPRADLLGYWGFVMPDHYMWTQQVGADATLDTWTALTYLAAKTEKIHLGTLVSAIPFRPPALLAKIVSTLDIISNGRTILGVGAGWSLREFEGYSKWDEPKVRVDKTAEGLELILKLWTASEDDTVVNFSGKHYSAINAVLEPKPVQKPYPPVLFGGTSPRMFKLAGQFADICLIPPWMPEDKAEEARKTILQEAEERGRRSKVAFAEILREAMSDSPPSPQSQSPKYDLKSFSIGVERIKKSGSQYVILPVFGSYEIMSDIVSDFGRDIIPSYSSAS